MMKAAIYAVSFLMLLALVTEPAPVYAQMGVMARDVIETDEQALTIRLDGIQSIGISVVGSCTCTLEFEASLNGGETFVSIPAFAVDDFAAETSTQAAGNWVLSNAGYTHFRVRASAFTNGSPSVFISRGYGIPVIPTPQSN